MRHVSTAALCFAVSLAPLAAQQPGDQDLDWRIRREAIERSQVMPTMHVLTDLYGPRLTGSPNIKAAGEWAVGQLTKWGLKNGRLEPWDFGHPGWMNERFSGFITAPVKDTLVGEVVAWTPGTNGTAAGSVVVIVPPEKPTQAEMDEWIDTIKPQVKGRIVLVGRAAKVAVAFNPTVKRREDAEVRAQYDPVNPAPSPFAAMMNQPPPKQEGPKRLTANEITEQIDLALVAAGALVRVNDAGREHGQIRAFGNRTFDVTKALPTVVLRNEDYGRITRLIDGGRAVELEFTIVNQTYPEGRTQYNVVAEIPGTDKADEIVMLGGHLDSWHAATGATDNAIGVAVMMEAARILAALDVKPRRTIRVALWGAEEQGLLGSQAYVKEHFGSFENPKPEFEKLVAYFNVDSGTGRARGMSVFGPSQAAAVVREALAPYDDLGVFGATATRTRRLGGSDHTAFNVAGLAGIGIGQDPIEYGSHTWHTNLDTYERIVPDDAVKTAIAAAAAVLQLATREERLPRFAKDEMPAPPAAEGRPADAPAQPTRTAAPATTARPATPARQ
jgi:hypothetical protein